jgi:hypothetical protein
MDPKSGLGQTSPDKGDTDEKHPVDTSGGVSEEPDEEPEVDGPTHF